jgi:hypothetical protein
MFRITVAALVFVGSFHPPVQSQRFHAVHRQATGIAVFSRPEAPRPAPQKLAALAEVGPLPAQP